MPGGMRRRLVSFAIVFGVLCAACPDAPPEEPVKPVAGVALVAGPDAFASGMPLEVTLRFDVADDAPPFEADYLVFLHFLDESGGLLGASDHAPPTPTRAWRAGETIEYTHALFAPISSYLGPATLITGLYSRATGTRLPLRGAEEGARVVELARLDMRERADPFAITFVAGWHAPESPAGSGIEWRWSTKSGFLSFPRPRHDAELVLQLDQPVDAWPVHQHVDVMLGDRALDGFDLVPGRVELRRIPLVAADLPATDEIELEILADKTYVPAEIAALGSSDTRRLGVRVLRAFVEPGP
jgi:hypothetical protein